MSVAATAREGNYDALLTSAARVVCVARPGQAPARVGLERTRLLTGSFEWRGVCVVVVCEGRTALCVNVLGFLIACASSSTTRLLVGDAY